MNKDNKSTECCDKKYFTKMHHHRKHCQSNAIYGLGVIGALFYFLQNATTFGVVIIGIGKSIFWPAILIFKLLTYLQM